MSAGMTDMPLLSTRKLAPLFILIAVFNAAAVVTRFADVALMLPASVETAILLAQFPLLLIAGYFEGRLDYGESAVELPLWMRIQSKPVKLAFTLAFTYLAIVVLQTWDIELGPVDPSPPAEWPLQQRAGFFAMMTAAMFFPNYLAAASLLIPGLRAVTRPLHRLPAAAGLAITSVVGVVFGFVVVKLVASQGLKDTTGSIQDALESSPAVAIGIAFGMAWIPIIWGLISARKEE